jgi:hypothetical protein
MLGLAIGDASGHGLPAALLVRDVVTGLRMGIEKDLKVAYVFSKLNRVIHRSNLSSRFISVFYGELEADGNLIYINAGHFPPVLFFKDPQGPQTEVELATGGTVIGPLPEAQFRRGFARIRPGEVLVLCTDGILERRDAKGEFFGTEGLAVLARKHMAESAEEILERIFGAAVAFGEAGPSRTTRPWWWSSASMPDSPHPTSCSSAVLRSTERATASVRALLHEDVIWHDPILRPTAATCADGRSSSATGSTKRPSSRAAPPACGSKTPWPPIAMRWPSWAGRAPTAGGP